MGGEAEGGFVATVAEGGWLQNQECEKRFCGTEKKVYICILQPLFCAFVNGHVDKGLYGIWK